MAVSKMSFISMIGPMKNINKLVNICGEMGVFQPDNVFSFYSNTENFKPIAEENPYAGPLQNLKNAVYSCGGVLEKVDIKGFNVNQSKIERYVSYISENIENMVDEKRALYGKIENYKSEIEQLKHFYGLNKKLKDIMSCSYIKPKFGRIPLSSYEGYQDLFKKSEKKGIELVFFPFEKDNDYQWGLYFADTPNEQEIDRLFASIYFEEIKLEPHDATPFEACNNLRNLQKDIYKKIESIDKNIENFLNANKEQCYKFYTKLKELSTYFEIKSYAAQYNESFILVGWVPKDDLKKFTESIGSIKGIEYSTEEGSKVLNHTPPVKLKNPKIFKPFEFLVDTYGLPSYNELDPTVFVAITYNILFGIMFADLGQGLMVSLVGYLMWKLKKNRLGKIMISCGFFSAIFGTIFGSVFGFEHVLDPFYKNVFGLPHKPIEVMESSSINYIIYSAVGVGIFLMVVSMLFGIYAFIKKKQYGEALFSPNGLMGLIFYCSMVFMLLDMVMLHTGVVNGLYITALLVIPLVCMMFEEILIKLVNKDPNWLPEKWGDYIAQSFFELFEVMLSYVSNTMSFLRVGAFVLVHAGMMMVVFTMAEMAGDAGGITYWVIVVVGNIIISGLEALLAGIQVMRLEFYEMFSKFFEGQGKVFTPITVSDNN